MVLKETKLKQKTDEHKKSEQSESLYNHEKFCLEHLTVLVSASELLLSRFYVQVLWLILALPVPVSYLVSPAVSMSAVVAYVSMTGHLLFEIHCQFSE